MVYRSYSDKSYEATEITYAEYRAERKVMEFLRGHSFNVYFEGADVRRIEALAKKSGVSAQALIKASMLAILKINEENQKVTSSNGQERTVAGQNVHGGAY